MLPRVDAKEIRQVLSEMEGETETCDQGILVESNEPWLMKVGISRGHCEEKLLGSSYLFLILSKFDTYKLLKIP